MLGIRIHDNSDWCKMILAYDDLDNGYIRVVYAELASDYVKTGNYVCGREDTVKRDLLVVNPVITGRLGGTYFKVA